MRVYSCGREGDFYACTELNNDGGEDSVLAEEPWREGLEGGVSGMPLRPLLGLEVNCVCSTRLKYSSV